MKKLFFFLAVALPCFVFTAYGNEVNVIPETSGAGSEVVNNTGKTNGHEWVDLGLPSGIKWATCNVGASTPEGYGDYFAWGSTNPYNSDSYWKERLYTKTSLAPEDDAAHINWGGNWRMPTRAEQNELRTKCTWTWTTLNGIKGNKVTGPNGNSIFLPAAGQHAEKDRKSHLYDVGSYGYYWSSSVTLYLDASYYLNFNSCNVEWRSYERSCGLSVRAVCQ